ncbi:sulfatase [Flammeovirga agarivorans]|uniref:Sulfatase n=1 Tax=Flammeovirga agarivorans TaxID=2726742 RepID=A0A7X8SQN7_9BACT|nr:sulfatase [Flammeovirga agarivorans]NLR94618.1 sulfatase [Flammeovirga agarivorans]
MVWSKRYIFFFSLLSLFSCKSEKSKHYKTTEKLPNILFIIADDLGAHDLSTTGSQYYETPNIDGLAAKGIQFDQGYASCQVCSPSRASIMTGKSPARHGITDWIGALEGEKWRKKKRNNKLLPAYYQHALDTSYVTMPEAFKEHGYTTFFAGKWHIGDEGSLPEDHGFDINIGGFEAGSPKGGYFSPYKNPRLEDGPKGENLSMRLANETVAFMKNNKDNPFFACLSFYAVHGPIQTTEEKWKKYRDKATTKEIDPTGYKMGKFLPIRQYQDNPVYAGLVESMDDAVGRVLSSLDELGLSENTIIVFTGDNGGVSAGDSFSTSNLPLKGGKGYQFEGGLRTPYIIKVPGNKHQGIHSDVPVTGTDFYPTLLDLAGLPLYPEQHQDGISVAPIFEGKKTEERAIVWHYPHYGNQGGEPSSVIRSGKWKLIHYYEDNREELYNLEEDGGELTDLSADYPSIVKNLSDGLFTYLNDLGANYPEEDKLWTKDKEDKYLNKVGTVKMKSLEKSRINMLGETYQPNADWWGSQLIVD